MEEMEIYSQVNFFHLYIKVRWILTHYIDIPEEAIEKCISMGNDVLDNINHKVWVNVKALDIIEDMLK